MGKGDRGRDGGRPAEREPGASDSAVAAADADLPGREVALEEFASITAAVGAGTPLDASLAEAGLSPEAWESAQQAWLARLAADAQSGRLELGREYTALARTRGDAAANRAARGRRTLTGALPVAPRSRIGRLARGSVSTPSSMLPSAPTGRAQPSAPPPPPDHEQTGLHTVGAAGPRDPLPFRPASRAEPVAIPAPAIAPVAGADPHGETSIFAAPDASTRPVLPFSPGEPEAASNRSKTAELPVVRRGTERIDLPTDRDPLATAHSGSSVPAAVLPFSRPPDAPEPAAGAARRDALPFRAPPAADERIDRISLAEYAQICAAVRRDPDGAAAVGASHGLDAEAWHALHLRWRARFHADPALHARWGALVIAFASRGD